VEKRTAEAGKRRVACLTVFGGRKGGQYVQAMADGMSGGRGADFACRSIGTLDDAGGRRDPFVECGARQILDWYDCVRRCGISREFPSPVREAEKMDCGDFPGEHTEGRVYRMSGRSGRRKVKKLLEFLTKERMAAGRKEEEKQIRMDSGVGIKPISPLEQRCGRRAIQYGWHTRGRWLTRTQGEHSKVKDGAFRDWGIEDGGEAVSLRNGEERESWILDNLEKNPG